VVESGAGRQGVVARDFYFGFLGGKKSADFVGARPPKYPKKKIRREFPLIRNREGKNRAIFSAEK
jgi:hypothetical protein